nr:hypothetical protein [Tanacetum cinerariifolium]
SPVRDVSEGEACPTESGFIADQDRAQEVEILRLKERVQVLEDSKGVVAKHSGDDAPIKGKSINEGEAAAERISNDSEDVARVLTSIDAATVLARGIDVPTGSGSIPTAGPPGTVISTSSEVGPTASLIVGLDASPIVTSYSRRNGKEVMVESDTPKKQRLQEQINAQVARELEKQQEKEDIRMNEQIARDAKVARIHVEEELQGMIDSLDKSNETIAKYLQEHQEFALELPLEKRIELISDLKKEYYMAMIRNNLGWKVKDFEGLSFKEIEAKFTEVRKQVEDFIPIGSKEEAERLKRKGLNLEQEHVKKQKSSEQALEMEKSTEVITQEKMKEMMQLIPIEDVYVQALQVKHPIIDWNVYTEDLLKQLDREDLNQLWDLVKEYISIRPATSEKEMELWVELKRLYESDPGDQLSTVTQNFMHAPVEWKLYDLSKVHHLTAKDKEIFMLVEKDYPLRKGLALVMISYKLQYKFPLPVKTVATVRRIEMPLPKVCTAIEEKKKKLQSKIDGSYTKIVPHVLPMILAVTAMFAAMVSMLAIPSTVIGQLNIYYIEQKRSRDLRRNQDGGLRLEQLRERL